MNSSVVRKFFSTPKGLLILILTALALLAAVPLGLRIVLPFVAAAVVVPGIVDALVLRQKNGIWEVPDGAILTGPCADARNCPRLVEQAADELTKVAVGAFTRLPHPAICSTAFR